MTSELHPAQNRGLRELYATTRQLLDHWSRLEPRFEGSPAGDRLRDGSRRARALIDELMPLTASYGIYGGPAAQGVGVSLAGVRSRVADRFLERNQGLRTAVLDIQHVVTLLGYQARIAEARAQVPLAEALRIAERDLGEAERALRAAAVEQGADPDAAIEPLDQSKPGRTAHGVQYAVGSVGEWIDRRRGHR